MKKTLMIIAIIAASAIGPAFGQTYTSHWGDGTYTSVTIIGNDAYYHHGTERPDRSGPGYKLYRDYGGIYSRRSEGSYTLVDAEVTYYDFKTDYEVVTKTETVDGMTKVSKGREYKYFITKTVYTGQARMYYMEIKPDTLYYTKHYRMNEEANAYIMYSDNKLKVTVPDDKHYDGTIYEDTFDRAVAIGIRNFVTEYDKGHTELWGGSWGSGSLFIEKAEKKSSTKTEVDRETYEATKKLVNAPVQDYYKKLHEAKENKAKKEANDKPLQKFSGDFRFTDEDGRVFEISIMNPREGVEIDSPAVGSRYMLAFDEAPFPSIERNMKVLGILTIKNMPYFCEKSIPGELDFEQYTTLAGIKFEKNGIQTYLVPEESFEEFTDRFINKMGYSRLARKYGHGGYNLDYLDRSAGDIRRIQ